MKIPCLYLELSVCAKVYIWLIFAFSFCSAPDGAPQSPQASTLSSTDIRVQWDEVPEQQRNGPIIVYEILVDPAQFQPMSSKNVSSPTMMVDFSGLEEYVVYTFTIRAYTSAGVGPSSIQTTTRTDTAG